jgi:polysaccharide export outer membrane protein
MPWEIPVLTKMNKSAGCLRKTVTVLSLLCLVGCSNSSSPTPSGQSQVEANASSFVAEEPAQQAEQDYVLQENDVCEVKFAYEPQLNEVVTIRPDGKISLQLVDETKAAGLTCSQLVDVLKKKYSRVLSQPEITVIVREVTGQKVYVGGEVKRSGIVDLKGRMTVLEAIFGAGGFAETAQPKNVIVISKISSNVRSVRKVDVTKILRGTPVGEELILKPYDVVYVPKTAIAEANKFVEQNIRNMIPINLSAGFSYTKYQD